MGRKIIYRVREKTGPLTADNTGVAAVKILPEEQKQEERRQRQHDWKKEIVLERKMIGTGEEKTVTLCVYGCTFYQIQELKWTFLKILL